MARSFGIYHLTKGYVNDFVAADLHDFVAADLQGDIFGICHIVVQVHTGTA